MNNTMNKTIKSINNEYNIDSKKIGLYFINFKSDSDKSGNVLSNHKENCI